MKVQIVQYLAIVLLVEAFGLQFGVQGASRSGEDDDNHKPTVIMIPPNGNSGGGGGVGGGPWGGRGMMPMPIVLPIPMSAMTMGLQGIFGGMRNMVSNGGGSVGGSVGGSGGGGGGYNTGPPCRQQSQGWTQSSSGGGCPCAQAASQPVLTQAGSSPAIMPVMMPSSNGAMFASSDNSLYEDQSSSASHWAQQGGGQMNIMSTSSDSGSVHPMTNAWRTVPMIATTSQGWDDQQ